jgi:hypothetical protein
MTSPSETNVGNDPDHEPLVDQVRPIARIADTALQEAVLVYRARFEPGQDSRH